MKRKILFFILFLLMIFQFILININFKKETNIDNIIKKDTVTIYDRYFELKNIKNLEIKKVENENESIVSEVFIKGNFNEIKFAISQLEKYKIIDYKLQINEKELEVLLSII